MCSFTGLAFSRSRRERRPETLRLDRLRLDAQALNLPALTALRRVRENQLGETCNGYESRILQIVFGKLHAKALLDFSNKFHDFHGCEPTCLKVIGDAQGFRCGLADFLCEFSTRDKPLREPILNLIPQLNFLVHFSMATQR